MADAEKEKPRQVETPPDFNALKSKADALKDKPTREAIDELKKQVEARKEQLQQRAAAKDAAAQAELEKLTELEKQLNASTDGAPKDEEKKEEAKPLLFPEKPNSSDPKYQGKGGSLLYAVDLGLVFPVKVIGYYAQAYGAPVWNSTGAPLFTKMSEGVQWAWNKFASLTDAQKFLVGTALTAAGGATGLTVNSFLTSGTVEPSSQVPTLISDALRTRKGKLEVKKGENRAELLRTLDTHRQYYNMGRTPEVDMNQYILKVVLSIREGETRTLAQFITDAANFNERNKVPSTALAPVPPAPTTNPADKRVNPTTKPPANTPPPKK